MCYNDSMDSVKKLTWLNYFICLVGFVAEIIFAFKLNPQDNSVFIFLIAWGTIPLITLLLFLIKTPRLLYSMTRVLIQTSAVVAFGIIYKINSIYIHPDPRGALALATIPIIQIIGALFIGLVIKITSQRHYRSMASQEEHDNL
jgi:low temperature requirement protein LtrA